MVKSIRNMSVTSTNAENATMPVEIANMKDKCVSMHGDRTNKRYSSIHRQVVTANMHFVIFALISFHINPTVK